MTAPSTVVFDLGGVLIDWDPRHLYRRLLPDDEIDDFLDEIGFAEWNHAQDAGGSWDEAVEALAARHPHRRELIAAYTRRYPETMAGPIEGTVRLLTQLRAAGTRLLALTNWSAETFHHALSTFGFLEMFEDIVVSGVEGVAKPDPRLFTLLIERFALVPAETVFIDDSAANVAAAAELGLTALRFRDPDALRADLRRLGLPVDA
ncbi:MAG: HAD family hydrolase [Actinomycetes bacterium]